MKLSKKLILASGSPRRKEILSQAGFDFAIVQKNTDETYPPDMPCETVAGYLAEKKARAFADEYADNLILTADTIVVVDGKILNKPQNYNEAFEMLKCLSGRSHTVYTGICLKNGGSYTVDIDATEVIFDELSHQEIKFYIDTCRPFDKAGGYGVQDFIGMVGIGQITGSFYTVMGLPIQKVYKLLKPYILW